VHTGRISLEELERRIELAMSAQTVDDLAKVVRDLPGCAVSAAHGHRRGRVRVGPPGIRPFTRRIVVPAPIERTRAVALDTIAPGLNGVGYELRRQSPTGLEFQRSPKERIALEEHGPSATMMIVHGRAARHVRKTFAKLDFG
jgi:hypothetical protein